jgi:8-oxo-dGTP pyrophosphatase MutT (NUDIX family)
MRNNIVYASVSLLRAQDPPHDVLLGVKTRKIGAGLYNGTGGIIEFTGETAGAEVIDTESVREIREEVNVVVDPMDLQKRAVIDCHNYYEDGTPYVCRLFVSFAVRWVGTPTASEELIDLGWFAPDALPLKHMMPGDRDWMPRVARGEYLVGHIYYAPGMRLLERPSSLVAVTDVNIERLWTIP